MASETGRKTTEGEGEGRIVISPQTVWTVAAVVMALIASYHGFNVYLDSRIDARMRDPDFQRELARSARPSLVFDSSGTVLSDQGAMGFLGNLDVAAMDDKGSLAVTIEPREFLPGERFVESLDGDSAITVKRGMGISWVVEIRFVRRLLLSDSPKRDVFRFRLEILR